jgi:hypothetical protein
MLERIDRVFISNPWDAIYPSWELHSLASSYSDQAPLLLCIDSVHHAKKRFYFRSFWTHLSGFWEVMQQTWHCPLCNVSPFCKLDWLIHNMARFLMSWSSQFVGSIQSQLEITKEVVHRLEVVWDRRVLSTHEEDLRKLLKLKSLGLTSLQRTIVCQEYGLLWLKRGMPTLGSSTSMRMCGADGSSFTHLRTAVAR